MIVSMPSCSGIMMSVITTSGCSSQRTAMPRLPSEAVTTSYPALKRIFESAYRTRWSSSITRIFMISLPAVLSDCFFERLFLDGPGYDDVNAGRGRGGNRSEADVTCSRGSGFDRCCNRPEYRKENGELGSLA